MKIGVEEHTTCLLSWANIHLDGLRNWYKSLKILQNRSHVVFLGPQASHNAMIQVQFGVKEYTICLLTKAKFLTYLGICCCGNFQIMNLSKIVYSWPVWASQGVLDVPYARFSNTYIVLDIKSNIQQLLWKRIRKYLNSRLGSVGPVCA